MYFTYNDCGEVVVYVDGACPGNGSPRARAGVGVWFGDHHELNVSSSMPGIQTNNNAEIYAAIRAIEILLNYRERRVEIMTDSKFLCNCMSTWIYNWKRNGWVNTKGKTVANKGMLQRLDRLFNRMESVELTYVQAHTGNHGNEQADNLARQGAYQSR